MQKENRFQIRFKSSICLYGSSVSNRFFALICIIHKNKVNGRFLNNKPFNTTNSKNEKKKFANGYIVNISFDKYWFTKSSANENGSRNVVHCALFWSLTFFSLGQSQQQQGNKAHQFYFGLNRCQIHMLF